MPTQLIIHVAVETSGGSSPNVRYVLVGNTGGASIQSGKGGLQNKIYIPNTVTGDVTLRFMLTEPQWKFVAAADHAFGKDRPDGPDDVAAFRDRGLDGPKKVFSCVHSVQPGGTWWHAFKVSDGNTVYLIDPEIENED
jgi:hypothetical protein